VSFPKRQFLKREPSLNRRRQRDKPGHVTAIRVGQNRRLGLTAPPPQTNRGSTPYTVTPAVQSACICFKSSRLWASRSRTRFCSAIGPQSRGRASRVASDARLRTDFPAFKAWSRLSRFNFLLVLRFSPSLRRAEPPVRPGLRCRTAHGYQELPPNHKRYSEWGPISAWA
jgi:hypothetical protein